MDKRRITKRIIRGIVFALAMIGIGMFVNTDTVFAADKSGNEAYADYTGKMVILFADPQRDGKGIESKIEELRKIYEKAGAEVISADLSISKDGETDVNITGDFTDYLAALGSDNQAVSLMEIILTKGFSNVEIIVVDEDTKTEDYLPKTVAQIEEEKAEEAREELKTKEETDVKSDKEEESVETDTDKDAEDNTQKPEEDEEIEAAVEEARTVILEEAQKAADEIIAEAKAEAEGIIEDARTEAKAEAKSIIEEAKAEAEEIREQAGKKAEAVEESDEEKQEDEAVEEIKEDKKEDTKEVKKDNTKEAEDDKAVKDAEDEAVKIVEEARAKAEGIVTDANDEAMDIVAAAKSEAEKIVKAAEEKTETSIPEVPGDSYKVARGDCLWNIAEEVYGDGARWVDIYEANAGIISNPSLIGVGQVLVLP